MTVGGTSASAQAPRILVVEDERKIAASIKSTFEAEGFHAEVAHDGGSALKRLREDDFDAIVLDRMLPVCDGIAVLRTMRGAGDATPVLMLTARDTLDDRVEGLDEGADDYLTKPFAMPELLARIRALLRRNQGEPAPTRLKVADLEIDVLRRKAWRGGQFLDLTAKEFDVLHLLAENAGSVVSREMLAQVVWNNIPRATPLDNVIDVHIARLRRKVDLPEGRALIETRRGVGFVLVKDE